MENLRWFRNNELNGISYRINKQRIWNCASLVYLLNDTAKANFKNFLNIDADFCILKNCHIIEWQQQVNPTDKTHYALYSFDENWEPRIIN